MTKHPANVRDLGGLPLRGGGVTRAGVLLRGDAPYGGDEPPPLVAWPPRTVIDLRSARERTRSPYRWPDGTEVHHHQLFDGARLDRASDAGGLMPLYRAMLQGAAPAIASVVELVDRVGSTFVHCSAGKDRTGVTTAALLLVAGVEPAAVVADYRLTEQRMATILDRMSTRGLLEGWRVDAEWLRAPVEAVTFVIEALTSWPGGPRGWFLDHGASAAGLEAFVAALVN